MVKIEATKLLTEEKQSLLRKEKLTNKEEERLKELDKLIFEENNNFIKNFNPNTFYDKSFKKGMTIKELRKILNEKHDSYLIKQRVARDIVNQSVIIKREGKKINSLLVGKPSLEIAEEKLVELVMRF